MKGYGDKETFPAYVEHNRERAERREYAYEVVCGMADDNFGQLIKWAKKYINDPYSPSFDDEVDKVGFEQAVLDNASLYYEENKME